MKHFKLSKRLREVASFIPKSSFFADIGSDHAYLPSYVCSLDKTAKAIAGEVNIGPYKSAKKTVSSNHLSDVIDVRLGDGLEVIGTDPVDTIVLAGMGGGLITSILEAGRQELHSVERIIAQPNIDTRSIREWMYHNKYTLVAESLIEENNHIYEIVVAEKNKRDNPYSNKLLAREFLFGPFLLKRKSALFIEKWREELEQRQRIVAEIKRSKIPDADKIAVFEKEISWIQGVLVNEQIN